jgi:hypothetical protein
MNIAERQKPAPGELFLDHVAHFVADLAAAARLAESLGFVVTPESAHGTHAHAAGTVNRCIMLEAGYIEVRKRTARYSGVHLGGFGTPDAAAEQRRLADHGFAAEELPPGEMPEGRIEYVEHRAPESLWQPRYLEHANGVTGLAALYVVAEDPAATAVRWSRFSALLPRRDGDLVSLEMTRGRVCIGTRHALLKLFDEVPPAPALAGYAIACRDPQAFAGRCAKAGLRVRDRCVTLPPALGGSWLLA